MRTAGSAKLIVVSGEWLTQGICILLTTDYSPLTIERHITLNITVVSNFNIVNIQIKKQALIIAH
jgi:hypothetical protein